jgi:cell division protein ZapA (FtsZ GTPase activity inhibitor)
MDQQHLIPINVWLAGRSYRIRIRPEEEAAVRRAVKAADNQISELRRHYAGKDDQDFVAMCLLMYAADYATDPLQHPDLRKQVDGLIARIDAVLDEPEL